MVRCLFFLLFILSAQIFAQNIFELRGRVTDSTTNQPLQYSNILILNTVNGTATDELGKFSINISKGKWVLKVSYIGYKDYHRELNISSNEELDIKLVPAAIQQKDVTVTASKETDNVNIQSIDAKEIKLMPNLFSDPLRSVQVMAGVVTNNELSTGYNVRGGNYDENLIYLNGYEIYRPFLLRQAGEDMYSLINPDMVSRLNFYNGAFTARYGDKMSSALDVGYSGGDSSFIRTNIRADLLNVALNSSGGINKFSWNAGIRYSYPGSFMRNFQTLGDYNPSYSDAQFLADYKFSNFSSIEFFGLYALNSFKLNPQNWIGHFGGIGRGDFREVEIDYSGARNYKFYTALIGLRFLSAITENIRYDISISNYNTSEKENENVLSEIYYNGSEDENLYEWLKARTELINNELKYNSLNIKSNITIIKSDYSIRIGAEYQFNYLKNKIDEFIVENGDTSLLLAPRIVQTNKNNILNSFSFYIDGDYIINNQLTMNAGLRFTRYFYSGENLISPRINFTYIPDRLNKLSFNWGYYYQPPFINELRNPELNNLKSQKAVHYIAGWENQFKENIKFSAQIYYKTLDDLIPFYFEKMKMIYAEGNTREGYAFGADLQFDGEVVEGMRSLISYSYLDSKERNKNGGGYQRRLMDQTHTIQIFLQDKFRKHPNWQSHVKFLFGSGTLYYERQINTDYETGSKYVVVDLNNPQEYFLFFRVDMGLSASFEVSDKSKLLFVAEVLNVFNHLNYLGYEWVNVFKEYDYLTRIPHVLSRRFFNLRVELEI